MKKGFLRCAAIAMLMVFLSVGSVFAADDAGKNFIANKVGVGYQGMVAGSFLNGISVRGWIGDRVGLEASGFYGTVRSSIEEAGYKEDFDADLWIIEAKAMFAVVSRPYSKFYIGGKIGYGQINAKDFGEVDGSSILTPGVFIGSEWSFPQLPEVGFNFDVGYSWLIYDNKVNEDPYTYMDLKLSGVSATFGVHYYF
jgi:hypothetical protein